MHVFLVFLGYIKIFDFLGEYFWLLLLSDVLK